MQRFIFTLQSCSRLGVNLSDAQPGASVLKRDSRGGSTSKSSVTVARQRPIFHRPFLDDDVVTSSADEDAKATSCPPVPRASNHYLQTLDQLHETGKVALESPAHEIADVVNRAISPVVTNLEAEASTNDGRLSAALGLISLAARTQITCLENESSIGCHLPSPPAGLQITVVFLRSVTFVIQC